MRVGWVLVLLCAAASAQSLSSARIELIEELEQLAKWCVKKKLIGSRNRIYETILHYDSDHPTARKWLRYTKRGGKWYRLKEYRAPKDRNREAVPAFERRKQEIAARFKAQVYPRANDKTTPADERRRILRDILAIAPDDEEVRRANSEVFRGGRWVLRETVNTKKRRSELLAAAAKAIEAVPAPRPDKVTAVEQRLGLRWTGAIRGRWWRFVGTTEMREMEDALRVAEASGSFVAAALPDSNASRALMPHFLRNLDCAMYYFADAEQGRTFVWKHHAFDLRHRKFVTRLGGTYIPGTSQRVNWMSRRETRIDATARGAISILLHKRYGRAEKGWAHEGFGLYLSWYLVGTRHTLYVQRTKYAQQDRWQERARERGADWLALARDLRWEKKAPDWRFLVGKNLNQLTMEDVIHAHSLAAYMIEGHPKRVTEFLASYFADGNIDKALAHAYDLTLRDTETRLARWLEEAR